MLTPLAQSYHLGVHCAWDSHSLWGPDLQCCPSAQGREDEKRGDKGTEVEDLLLAPY